MQYAQKNISGSNATKITIQTSVEAREICFMILYVVIKRDVSFRSEKFSKCLLVIQLTSIART